MSLPVLLCVLFAPFSIGPIPLPLPKPFSQPVGVCAQWLDDGSEHWPHCTIYSDSSCRPGTHLPSLSPPFCSHFFFFFRLAYFGWTLFNKAICAWLTLVIVWAPGRSVWPGADNLWRVLSLSWPNGQWWVWAGGGSSVFADQLPQLVKQLNLICMIKNKWTLAGRRRRLYLNAYI